MAVLAAALLLTGLWLLLIGRYGLKRIAEQLLAGRGGQGGISRGRAGGKYTDKYAERSARKRHSFKELILTEPIHRLLERIAVYNSFQLSLGSYHLKLVILEGVSWTMEQTKARAAESVGIGCAALIGSAWVSWLSAEPLMLLMGAIIGGVLAVRPFVEASRLLEQRKRAILAELPLMMSELMLLVGAGETVQGALGRCLDGKEVSKHPLYKEWRSAVDSLRNGDSFQMSLERFNRRCAVQEVSVFTTVLLLNYRKGGEHFVLALRELSYSLWEKRKAAAKSKGEEASSKLVFPLVGILLVLMLLVAAPAVMLVG